MGVGYLKTIQKLSPNKQVFIFFIFTVIVFYFVAFITASPYELFQGLIDIVLSRDVLITDYFVIGGLGAAFFNSAIVMTISLIIIYFLKLNISGLSIASVIIMGGFSFFGKNPINIAPIILGTFLYSYVHKVKSSRYIYIGFLATGVAPIITELTYILPFSLPINMIISFIVGLAIGYCIIPLSAHTVGVHMGYNIFNVGFAVGIIALTVMTVTSMMGLTSKTVLIWQEGRPLWLIILLYAYFAVTFLYGLIICSFKLKDYFNLLKHPGRAIADFLLMDGVGAAMINMATVGAISLTYILIIKGDLSGPVLGAIITIMGFGAFGIHTKNFPPVLFGVFLASSLGIYSPQTSAFQLAAIFSGALAPIAGQYGIIAGIVAGFLHSAIVSNTGALYSGMNLYNNGFSAGLVAMFLVPLLESLAKSRHKHGGS